MFRHEGPARSTRANEALAAYLALTAGFVNAAGFLLVGTYTSHVSGSVGRSGIAVAEGAPGIALAAVELVGGFFLGALLASLLVSGGFRRVAVGYGLALLLEAAALTAFVVARASDAEAHPFTSGAMLLSLAMGMQNSLVTHLSGAVVRTTHLTGVITDLGIEAAGWLRFRRGGDERPTLARGVLLAIIASAFTIGSVLGAMVVMRVGRLSMLAPAAAVALGGVYALRTPGPARVG